MKRIKYFVLSLLVCFSFGCTTKAGAEKSFVELAKVSSIDKMMCFRSTGLSSYDCVAEINSSLKKLECDDFGCTILKCSGDTFCFQSNDTE
jgi:hypothetical protein